MAGKHAAKRIAQKRIDYLYELAQRWAQQKRMDDSRTAIRHLRKLATSHAITTPGINKNICKQCDTLLLAETTTVRIRKDKRIITCKNCNTIIRRSY